VLVSASGQNKLLERDDDERARVAEG